MTAPPCMRRWIFVGLGSVLGAGLWGGPGNARAQVGALPLAPVTYVSAGMVYIGAGSAEGLAPGDTVVLGRMSLVLLAVSTGSAVIRYAARPGTIRVGDTVRWNPRTYGSAGGDVPTKSASPARSGPDPGSGVPAAAPQQPEGGTPGVRLDTTRHAGADSAAIRSPALGRMSGTGPRGALAGGSRQPPGSTLRGRVALQYVGAGSPGKTMDFSQPSALLQLFAGRLFGTGLRFSFYGRTNYDLSALFPRYGTGSRLKNRVYEMALSYDDEKLIGFDAGRILSRYAGGLGQVDGLQFFVREGRWTAGILAGTQPDYLTSGLDPSQQKGAVFVNFASGPGAIDRTDVTIAYGRQLHEGRFDRDFLFLQGSTQLGTFLSLYQSSEADLHVLRDGERATAFRLTNTFLTLSYFPLEWLTVSGGYDATRNIYLFDSMRSIADSLLDHELRQGFRAGLDFRLPANLIASVRGTYRPKAGETRDSRTLGGSVRSFAIGGTPLGAGFGLTSITGAYTDGSDITLDADWSFGPALALNARLDRYAFHVVSSDGRFRTTTLTGMMNLRLSRSWYAMLSLDQVWDDTRTSQRIYAEIGVRF